VLSVQLGARDARGVADARRGTRSLVNLLLQQLQSSCCASVPLRMPRSRHGVCAATWLPRALAQEAAVEQFRRELEARTLWRKEDHGAQGLGRAADAAVVPRAQLAASAVVQQQQQQ
jgi:hypothetical protein